MSVLRHWSCTAAHVGRRVCRFSQNLEPNTRFSHRQGLNIVVDHHQRWARAMLRPLPVIGVQVLSAREGEKKAFAEVNQQPTPTHTQQATPTNRQRILSQASAFLPPSPRALKLLLPPRWDGPKWLMFSAFHVLNMMSTSPAVAVFRQSDNNLTPPGKPPVFTASDATAPHRWDYCCAPVSGY